MKSLIIKKQNKKETEKNKSIKTNKEKKTAQCCAKISKAKAGCHD